MRSKKTLSDTNKLDKIVAEARRNREQREATYRELALKIYPWICGRCAREFTRENIQSLTVHHRDHNHSNNPSDGSNWELLCIYCHENEHTRHIDNTEDYSVATDSESKSQAVHRPFAKLKSLLKK